MVLWKQAQRLSVLIPLGVVLAAAPAACARHPAKDETSITTVPQKKSVVVSVSPNGNIESVRPYRAHVKRLDKVEWVFPPGGFRLEIKFKAPATATKATCSSDKCEVTVDLEPGRVYDYMITVYGGSGRNEKKDELDPELEVER